MSEPIPGAPPDWRRLHPRMLLVHPVNELIQFFPAVVAAFIFGDQAHESGWVQAIAVLVPILLGVARYLTTAWRITGSSVEVRRGLLSRKVLTAPLDRVRTVELTSPLIHRVLGLAKVQVGTGSGGSDKLELDALTQAEGRTLRSSLLHRAGEVANDESAQTPGQPETSTDPVLLQLLPGWARYAPFTSTGLAIAGIGAGALAQFGRPLADRLDLGPHLPDLAGLALVAVVLAGLVGFAVLCAVLAVISYVVTNWSFTLSRDALGRSFHITRGLFTTRETSLDVARLHGVTVAEPIGLRAAGAAQLSAVATGLDELEDSSAVLVPPAPRTVVDGVAELVLAADAPRGTLATPLTPHGPRAARRRWTRGIAAGVILAGLWTAGVWALDLPAGLHVASALLLAGNAWLANDRARRLGHALTDTHVVFRSGALLGSTTALERRGIIGWNLDQSWWQRRSGLVTITATTAAGGQSYGVVDVPREGATGFIDAATPGLLAQFLA